jgi:hypothetical protein
MAYGRTHLYHSEQFLLCFLVFALAFIGDIFLTGKLPLGKVLAVIPVRRSPVVCNSMTLAMVQNWTNETICGNLANL